jgi:hypothetical protein
LHTDNIQQNTLNSPKSKQFKLSLQSLEHLCFAIRQLSHRTTIRHLQSISHIEQFLGSNNPNRPHLKDTERK